MFIRAYLLVLGLVAIGCHSSANGARDMARGARHDMTMLSDGGVAGTPDLGSDDLGATDMNAVAMPDLMATPDLRPAGDMAYAATPNLSADDVVDAVLHLGTSWYLGGNFSRLSTHVVQGAVSVDTSGALAGCDFSSGFDGTVRAIVAGGGSIFAGGSFTHYRGSPAMFIAKIDAVTCALDTTFSPPSANGFDDVVFALALDSAGGNLYVGGAFQQYRGDNAERIIELAVADGSPQDAFDLDPDEKFNGFDNDVFALALQGGVLYAGGEFTSYRAAAAGAVPHLAALDATTGALDTALTPAASGFDDTVASLAATPNALYVGGYFYGYRGVADSAHRFAKLDLTKHGALDTTFTKAADGFDDAVLAVAVSGSTVYAGGLFTTYRGNGAGGLTALDSTSGAPISGFATGVGFGGGEGVYALMAVGARLYAAGHFLSYAGSDVGDLARLDAATGALDGSFHPAGETAPGMSGGSVGACAIAQVGNDLVAGGDFTLYGGWSAGRIARIDDVSFHVDPTFTPTHVAGFDDVVKTFASDGNSLFVGGNFNVYGTTSAEYAAKIDLASGKLQAFVSDDGFDNEVDAITVMGSYVYVGGQFTVYDTTSVGHVAQLDKSGNLQTAFSSGAGCDGSVWTLANDGSFIYAGGEFTRYNGAVNSRIVKLASDGSAITTFDPVVFGGNGANDTIYSLVTDGTSLWAGGAFTSYSGLVAGRVARMTALDGDPDQSFSPQAGANGFDATVYSLALGGDELYCGGALTMYSGANATQHLAKLDGASGTLDATFDTSASNLDGDVLAVGVNGGTAVIGGSFTRYRSAARVNLAIVDSTTAALK